MSILTVKPYFNLSIIPREALREDYNTAWELYVLNTHYTRILHNKGNT